MASFCSSVMGRPRRSNLGISGTAYIHMTLPSGSLIFWEMEVSQASLQEALTQLSHLTSASRSSNTRWSVLKIFLGGASRFASEETSPLGTAETELPCSPAATESGAPTAEEEHATDWLAFTSWRAGGGPDAIGGGSFPGT